MKSASCPCCSDQRIWKAVEETLKSHGLDMRYCPVCSNSAGIRWFLHDLQAQLKAAIPEIVIDENGKPMYQDRTPWSDPKPGPKRMSYEMDLDKIDISREMELLEKHQQKEKDRKAEILADHVVRLIIKKYGDNNQ